MRFIQEGHLGGCVDGGDPNTYTPTLWHWLIRRLRVKSVLDIGCGQGHAARYFKDSGCVVRGVDGCKEALATSVVPGDVVLHDFVTGPYIDAATYDLVWSCEFVEHVDRRHVKNILTTFSACCGEYLAMTHAVPGQSGYHHVNCQSSDYWIKKLKHHGFTLDLKLTMQSRRVMPLAEGMFWRSTGMLFKQTRKPVKWRPGAPRGPGKRVINKVGGDVWNAQKPAQGRLDHA